MTLTISLPVDCETRLKARAEAAEPLARAVDAAGVSDEQFTAVVRGVRDALRRKPA